MAENFILEEIITDLTDGTKSLLSPLMRLQYFAERIKNEELLHFVLSELNGYKGRNNLPDYRTSLAIIHVDIQFGETRHSDLEVPVELIEEKNRNLFNHFYLNEPITVLEQMALDRDKGQYLILNLPLTFVHIFQDAAAKIYKNSYFRTDVIAVRLLCNRNILPRALTAIRSRLLSFCMKIGETFGYNIVINSFNKSQSINNEKIVHLMSTVINNQGDGNIINSGDNANIQATINIAKGNKQQLNNKLKELGVEQNDIDELDAILEDEPHSPDSKILGDKKINWITKVSGKALKGVGSIAKEVTSSLLANLLMQYLGIPPIN